MRYYLDAFNFFLILNAFTRPFSLNLILFYVSLR